MNAADPFDRIVVPPVTLTPGPTVAQGLQAAKFVPAYAVEQPLSNAPGGGGDVTIDGPSVISAIIASGGVFTEFTYCDSGSPVTAWWPIWEDDPTP